MRVSGKGGPPRHHTRLDRAPPPPRGPNVLLELQHLESATGAGGAAASVAAVVLAVGRGLGVGEFVDGGLEGSIVEEAPKNLGLALIGRLGGSHLHVGGNLADR